MADTPTLSDDNPVAPITDVVGGVKPDDYIRRYTQAYKTLGGQQAEDKLAATEDEKARKASEAQGKLNDLAKQKDKLEEDQQKSIISELERDPGLHSGDIHAPSYQPVQMQDIQSNIFPLMFLAALAGRGQRRHAVGALSAFGAMLKGADEGRKEQYDAALSQYKAHISDLKAKQDAYDHRLGLIERNNKLTLDQKIHEIDQLQREFGKQAQDDTNTIRIYSNDVAKLKHDAAAQAMLIEKLESSADKTSKILGDHAASRAQKAASGVDIPLTADGLELANRLYTMGVSLPGGFGKGVGRGNEMLNEYAKKYGVDEAARMIAQGQSGQKADAGSKALLQKRFDAVDYSMKKIANDIKTMEGVMNTGAAGGVKLTNKPINVLKRELTSNKEFGAYALAVTQVGTEYERLLTGGALSVAQLHEGAREDAAKLLNGDMTPEEVKAKIPIMLREMENAHDAAKAQLGEIDARIADRAATPKPNVPTVQHSAPSSDGQPSIDDLVGKHSRQPSIPQ
jgi:hypothetical protein